MFKKWKILSLSFHKSVHKWVATSCCPLPLGWSRLTKSFMIYSDILGFALAIFAYKISWELFEKFTINLYWCGSIFQINDFRVNCRINVVVRNSNTVWFFSNETKDDHINPKPIDIIKFWRKKKPERVCFGIHSCQISAFGLK